MCPSSVQVTCVGHIIGAVVADTQLHAQRAAKAVKIQYEELQPVITSIQVRPDTPEQLWTNQGWAIPARLQKPPCTQKLLLI